MILLPEMTLGWLLITKNSALFGRCVSHVLMVEDVLSRETPKSSRKDLKTFCEAILGLLRAMYSQDRQLCFLIVF